MTYGYTLNGMFLEIPDNRRGGRWSIQGGGLSSQQEKFSMVKN